MTWRSYISTSDWHYNLLCLLALILPLNKRIVPPLIMACAIFAIIKAIREKKLYIEKAIFPVFLLMGIYFLHLAGLGHSRFPDDARVELEIKASFIAFPLLAWVLPKLSRQHIWKIADAFCTGALLFIPISLVYGVVRSINTHDWSYLTYEKLGIYFHPTYMAVYQCMALMWLFIRAGQLRHLYNHRTLHWAIGAIVVTYINLLESKAGILSVFLVVFVWIWSERHYRLGLKNAAINGVFVLSVLLAGMLLLPSTFGRVKRAVSDAAASTTTSTYHEADSSTDLRKVTLAASWELLISHPLGVGIGNTTPELVKIYAEKGEHKAVEKALNAHNQYLQTGAETGWAGVFLLLAFLWTLWRRAKQSDYVLFRCFVLLCAFNFLFESFLEVQAGIVFFCFWSLVFLKSETNEDHKKTVFHP